MVSRARRKTDPAPSAPRARHRGRGIVIGVAAVVVASAVAWWATHRRPAPNLLLVTIDTLRADHVGVYGAAGARPPTLHAPPARARPFEHTPSGAPPTGRSAPRTPTR